MPTAGRLTGAIAFAVLGGVLAWLIVPLFPEGRPPSYWFAICIAVGVLTGWIFAGSRTGQGTGPAIGTGLSAAVVLAFWVLFVIGGRAMIVDSMRGRFSGPTDAVIGIFGYMMDDAQRFADPAILTVWLLGAVIAALLTNLIGTRFR